MVLAYTQMLKKEAKYSSQLKQQLVTLTVAMATLAEEKSKMESNF